MPRSLNILLVHNYYQQWGGEDTVFEAEGELLERAGNRIRRYSVHNDSLGAIGKLTAAAGSVWNRRTVSAISQMLKDEPADIVHFHNTVPLISPAGYYAAQRGGAAVVQTLHNFRMFCPKAVLMRDGHVCEDCMGRTLAWPAVRHACYRDSRVASGVMASVLMVHNLLGTWSEQVDLNIVMSRFGRDKFIEAGLDEQRIAIKPHFVLQEGPPGDGQSGAALFVGRLSEEKGIATLLKAWESPAVTMPLVIVGDGPLAGMVQRASETNEKIRWVGRVKSDQIFDYVRDASVLIAPSLFYETFGMVVIEAFSVGTPVIVSGLGAIGELVEDGKTGFKFEPGNVAALVDAVSRFASDRDLQMRLRANALNEYRAKYTAERNYPILMDCYERAIATRNRRGEPITNS